MLDTQTLLIIGAVVVAFAVWWWYTSSKKGGEEKHHTQKRDAQPLPSPPPQAPQQHSAGAASSQAASGSTPIAKPTLVLFWAQNCPHCHSAKPEFAKAALKIQATGAVDVIDIEGASIPPQDASTLPGVPTIRVYPDGYTPGGRYVEYQGPRTEEGIVSFVMNGPQ